MFVQQRKERGYLKSEEYIYVLNMFLVFEMDNIQLADLQLLLQVMIGSSPSQQSEEQLSYFLCTCGAEFELYQEYYNHLMQEMGMSQQKTIHHQSSNYSNFSIVSAVKFEQESGSQASQEQTIFEEGYKNQEEYLKQESSEDELSIQSDPQSLPSSSLGTPLKRNCRSLKRWNDFLLIKNRKCKEKPFYCGNCEIIYFQIEDFVSHCVQQCHSFEHPASSHFITDGNQQKKRKNMLIQKSLLRRRAKIALQQYELIMDQVQCEPFNEIFRQHRDHKNLAFYCGICQYNFRNYKGFNAHIAQVHQQKIDPSSSHIILRFAPFTEKQRINFLHISPRAGWINEDEKYYCSCQPKIKITMIQLQKHVQEAHNGVSPFYQGKFKYVKPQKKARMNAIHEEIFQEEAEDYTLFLKIYNNKNDHRNIQFFCGECLYKTKNPRSYCRHMKHYSHGSKINRGSHVILRVIDKCDKIGNIYLSPAVEWETEEAIYFCACDVHKKMTMKDLIQHVYVQHNGISPYYPLNPITRLYAKYDQYFQKSAKDETIKQIISLHMVIKQGSFGCKMCKNAHISSPTSYARHIMRIHNGIVDPKYHTHILIKARYNKWQLTHYFYLPLISQFEDKCLKYYCPCQIDHKMNIKDLIEHILKQHNGVSPTYSLDQ